jgi:hypothetical protein
MINLFSPTGQQTFSATSLPLCYLQTIHIANRTPLTIVWEDATTQSAYNDMRYYDISESSMAEQVFDMMSGWSLDENTLPEEWDVDSYVTDCYFLHGYMIADVIPSPTPHIVFPVCYNFFGNITCTSIYNSATGKYDKIIVDIYTKNMTMDYWTAGGYISGPVWREFNPKGSIALYVYTSGPDQKTTDCLRVRNASGLLSLTDTAKTTKIVSSFDIRWGEDGSTTLGAAANGTWDASIYGGGLKSYCMNIPGNGSKRPILLLIAQKKFGPIPTFASEAFNGFLIPDTPLEVTMIDRSVGVYWGVFEAVASSGVYSKLRIIGAEALSYSYVRRWTERFAWEAFYSNENETWGWAVDSLNFNTDLAKAFILST